MLVWVRGICDGIEINVLVGKVWERDGEGGMSGGDYCLLIGMRGCREDWSFFG